MQEGGEDQGELSSPFERCSPDKLTGARAGVAPLATSGLRGPGCRYRSSGLRFFLRENRPNCTAPAHSSVAVAHLWCVPGFAITRLHHEACPSQPIANPECA